MEAGLKSFRTHVASKKSVELLVRNTSFKKKKTFSFKNNANLYKRKEIRRSRKPLIQTR
jgi:hypothetical protein